MPLRQEARARSSGEDAQPVWRAGLGLAGRSSFRDTILATAKKSRIREIKMKTMSRKCREEAENAAPREGMSRKPEYSRKVARGVC